MKRILSYIVLILLAFFLQNNVFAATSLIVTVPNILLILVFSFGFMKGSTTGMLIGFCCGLLSDVFFSDTLGFSAMIYTVLGYGIGLLGRLYYTEFVDMPLVLCLVSDLAYHLGIFAFGFWVNGQHALGVYIRNICLPELLYTAVMTVVLYPLLRKAEALICRLEARRTRSLV